MEKAIYMRVLPDGICFAHGPYTGTAGCPKWPLCITDPKVPDYVKMGMEKMGREATDAARIYVTDNIGID